MTRIGARSYVAGETAPAGTQQRSLVSLKSNRPTVDARLSRVGCSHEETRSRVSVVRLAAGFHHHRPNLMLRLVPRQRVAQGGAPFPDRRQFGRKFLHRGLVMAVFGDSELPLNPKPGHRGRFVRVGKPTALDATLFTHFLWLFLPYIVLVSQGNSYKNL